MQSITQGHYEEFKKGTIRTQLYTQEEFDKVCLLNLQKVESLIYEAIGLWPFEHCVEIRNRDSLMPDMKYSMYDVLIWHNKHYVALTLDGSIIAVAIEHGNEQRARSYIEGQYKLRRSDLQRGMFSPMDDNLPNDWEDT